MNPSNGVIIRLSADTTRDGDLIGGKGLGLVRLLAAGLSVPDAWCIPAPVSLNEAEHACLESELATWWSERGASGRWAVRSSAVAEDLADASFAGVYETVLGVDSLAALQAAVRSCWASLDNQRAQTYRGRDGVAQPETVTEDGAIALILQRMLRPSTAGVLLTANPMRPFSPELAIDATWGLGEALVSGRTDPDHFVLDRVSGAVRERTLGAKQLETVWTEERVIEQDVDADRRAQFCLNDAELTELHALAVAVGERIGPCRDLEWAFADGALFVLQDRPITTLPSENPSDVWSRGFGDEYLSDCSLPLPADLMVPWIVDIAMHEMAVLQGRPDLAERSPVRLHQGYAYFSGEYYAKGLRMLPRSMRTAGPSEWFPPLVHERARSERWDPRLLIGMLRAPGRDTVHSGLRNNLTALQTHCANIERDVRPLLNQDYTALDTAEWRRQYELIDALGREHFRVVRWGMTIYNPFLHSGLERLLRSWCDDQDGTLYQDVISGLEDTRTAGINREIIELAALAAADQPLAAMVRAGKSYAEVRASTSDSRFWHAYDGFLAEHGHRSDSRDIGRPRWREQPHLIIEFIRAQLRAGDGARGKTGSARERRSQAEAIALTRAGRGPAGAVRRRVLARMMQLVQDYTRYRENQRYHLDYLLTHLRALVLEQARRLVENGTLTEPAEVFFLTGPEFFALIDGELTADLTAQIAQRRAEFARNSRRLPATYLFDDVETEVESEDGVDVDLPAGALRGTGVCRGRAHGPARVVATLADLGQVAAGDILVAPNIDPGWTSVFPLLAGLVIETGGALSHGAILAREYGIPAVSGVSGATTAIADRIEIGVDGNTGLVHLPTPMRPA